MTQRVTITLDDETASALDQFMARRGYANRSEAMRDLQAPTLWHYYCHLPIHIQFRVERWSHRLLLRVTIRLSCQTSHAGLNTTS